jgi:hypothetical protein
MCQHRTGLATEVSLIALFLICLCYIERAKPLTQALASNTAASRILFMSRQAKVNPAGRAPIIAVLLIKKRAHLSFISGAKTVLVNS